MQQLLTHSLIDTCLHQLPQKLGTRDRDNARLCLIDSLACAFTAFEQAPIKALKRTFLPHPSRIGSSLIGYKDKARSDDAALINGTMISLQLFDDNQAQMRGHPSGPLLPAVLAVSEEVNATLEQALTAFVLGYELECRLGVLWNPSHYEKGWHATATQGAFGATLASAWLRKLNDEQTRHAFGICASLASGIRRNFGTMTMSLHSGLAASNGVKASKLASEGFTADTDVFDGAMNIGDVLNSQSTSLEIQDNLHQWGNPFMISDPGCTFKLYPCGRPPLFAIDCVVELQAKQHLKLEDIKQIECEVSFMYPRTLIHSNPSNGLQGKTSLQYCVAAAFLDGRPNLKSFSDESVNRAQAKQLIDRIKVIVPQHLSEDIPSVRKAPFEQPVTLRVETQSGHRYSETVHFHKGSPENPASQENLRDKFNDAVAPLLSKNQAALILKLAHDDQCCVTDLMSALHIDGF